MKRGLGHVADLDQHVEDDLRNRHIGHLVGAALVGAPTSLDYSGLLRQIPDQGGSSSCVGQAFATSIYLHAQITAQPIPRPSPKAIYDGARLLDAPHEAMVDFGSRPRSAIIGMQDFGLVAEDRWPLNESNVNVPPPLDVWQAGLGQMLSGWYRIASGQGAATLVRSALTRGFCPTFAMPVDVDYQNIADGTIYDGLYHASIGSHMQCVDGFGTGWLLVANSWGSSWGVRGHARISDAAFERLAGDILVPTVVPVSLA